MIAKLTACVAALGLTITGCTADRSPKTQAAAGGVQDERIQLEGGEEREVNWDNPGRGRRISGEGEARALVSYKFRMPRNLGSPQGMYVSPASGGTAQDRGVSAIYDSEKWGRVAVMFGTPSEKSAEEWEQSYRNRVTAPENSDPALGHFEVTTVGDKTVVLLVDPKPGHRTSAMWREGDLQVTILGPELTFDQALEVVEGY